MVLDCRLKHEKVKYYCHLVVKGYSHLCLHIHPFLFNCRTKKYGGGTQHKVQRSKIDIGNTHLCFIYYRLLNLYRDQLKNLFKNYPHNVNQKM